MKNKSGVLPYFAWPLLLLLAVVSILLLSISGPETGKVSVPVPPHLYSSSSQLIGTGNKLGTYYPAGHILADWFNSNLSDSSDKVFRGIQTNGSIDNIKLLQDGKILLGMVESRIVAEAFKKQKDSPLRLIWPLWPDVVQLIKSKENADQDFLNLQRGFPGQKNSSTHRTSREIFSSFGKNLGEVNLMPDMVLSRLADNKLDFAMIQAGIPNRTVSDAVIFHRCSLVSFSDSQIEKLLTKVSSSRPFIIPAGYYGEQQSEVQTLGIPNVLVARSDMASSTAALITELLSRSSVSLKIRHQAFADVPSSAAEALKILQNIKVPIHSGTKSWLDKQLEEQKNSDSEVIKTEQ
ncbi:MAG: TAXI family TRAP transporter solute-binding subunit [Candidatus Rifleibacteriota bacterium]